MSNCRLYGWGANSHGQLGLGYKSEQTALPHEVDLSLSDLDPKNILKIVGGAGHTLLLDRSGHVYSCGWNSRGQTGHPRDREVVLKFERIIIVGLDDIDDRIKDIACGWDGSMALTESGRLFVWGSNFFGQLGRNESVTVSGDRNPEMQPHEIIITGERIIKGVAMGLRHSAIVTENGKAFVTGSGSKSQLGILDSDRKPIRRLNAFTLIPGLADVVSVACGQNHTIAVTKNGDMYSWGDNKHGQLGIDNKKHKNIDYPRRFGAIGGPDKELRTGWTHTSFLNPGGNIFAWGRNTYGQLGYREEHKNGTWSPKCVPIGPKIQQLAVGSEHNLALTEDGTVFSWGWNEHGNCGNGSTRDVMVPERIEVVSRDAKAILVGSGAGHSFAVFIHEL